MIVSIIVPVYNSEKTISDCVDSLLNQTFKDFEILLIDDGSTDNSLSICNQLKKKDNRIIVICSNHSGVSSARNIGIDSSQGDYIVFVDSDDFVDEHYLEHLVCYSEYDLVVSKVHTGIRIQEDDKIFLDDQNHFCHSLIESTGSNLATIFREYNMFSSYNKLYKLRTIKDKNIRFEKGVQWGEDLIFVSEYLLNTVIICCTKFCDYYYNYNPNSLSHSLRYSLVDEIVYSRNKSIEILKQIKIDSNDADELIKFIDDDMKRNVSWILITLMKSKDYNIRNKCKLYRRYSSNPVFRYVLAHRSKYFKGFISFCIIFKIPILVVAIYRFGNCIKRK